MPGLSQTDAIPHAPRLLLTQQRLRRLKRDRDRQTVRWTNFEKRVQTVAGSPERGFETALYYAVTNDAQIGNAAVQWASTHICERRQVALVLDWVSELLPQATRQSWLDAKCPSQDSAITTRDTLFLKIASDDDVDDLIESSHERVIADLTSGKWSNSRDFYAALEYLYTVRTHEHTDVRDQAPEFFFTLPEALLLSLPPDQVDHPEMWQHLAALVLVALDPNLEGSQFLQAWAIEDKQILREGDGVAYEFLWADPYLPGVGYENLEPWSYTATGSLFARSDWNADSCWIHISPATAAASNCPADWQSQNMQFGRMTLYPLTGTCARLPSRRSNENAILWRLQPGQPVYFLMNDSPIPAKADAAGMWKVSGNVDGLVCTSPDTLKVPQPRKPARKQGVFR